VRAGRLPAPGSSSAGLPFSHMAFKSRAKVRSLNPARRADGVASLMRWATRVPCDGAARSPGTAARQADLAVPKSGLGMVPMLMLVPACAQRVRDQLVQAKALPFARRSPSPAQSGAAVRPDVAQLIGRAASFSAEPQSA
jgi:hypothetical protein